MSEPLSSIPFSGAVGREGAYGHYQHFLFISNEKEKGLFKSMASGSVAQASLQLRAVFSPQFPLCWGYRQELPHGT